MYTKKRVSNDIFLIRKDMGVGTQVLWCLHAVDELECCVDKPNNGHERAKHDSDSVSVRNQDAQQEIGDSSAQKGKGEGRVGVRGRRDLELKENDPGTEQDQVQT